MFSTQKRSIQEALFHLEGTSGIGGSLSKWKAARIGYRLLGPCGLIQELVLRPAFRCHFFTVEFEQYGESLAAIRAIVAR